MPSPVPITVSLVPASSSSSPPLTRKPPPDPKATPLKFLYAPSKDGKDRNLMVFFHGLGDTVQPFFALGSKQLNLPETAVLSIQAPLQIPLLEEPAFMFYPSFTTPDFEPIPNPNPSAILPQLSSLLTYLVSLGWEFNAIHLFGFGQGGSVASELALSTQRLTSHRLGSVVSVSGPLLSLPTPTKLCETPLLALHRAGAGYSKADLGAFGKGFKEVKEVRFGAQGGNGGGMVKGEGEWRVVMKFWSEVLLREGKGMGGGGEMFEVLSGGPKMG